jgi:hypothetical protein
MPKPTPKPQGTCIFCGGIPLTKEHLWGKWIRRYLKALTPKTQHLTSIYRHDRSLETPPPLKPGRLNRPGAVHSHQLRVVCKSCNGSWMKALQDKAKPTMALLVNDDWSTLNSETAEVLALWATMFTMTSEHADRNTVSTTFDQRAWFKTNQRVPANWFIFIGRYRETDPRRSMSVYNHHAFGVYRSNDEERLSPKLNTQTTTICLKNLLIHTFSTTSHIKEDQREFATRFDLRLIHPDKEDVIVRPERIHDYVEFNSISNDFPKRKGLPYFEYA